MNTTKISQTTKRPAPKRWEKTKVAGIRRDLRNGNFCINKKVHGRPFNESLLTTDFAEAKTRFYARIALREKEGSRADLDPLTKSNRLTLGDLSAIYLARAGAGAYKDLDPKTLDRFKYQFRSLRSSWKEVPGFVKNGTTDFDGLRPDQISYDDLLAWREFFLALPAGHPKHRAGKPAGLGYSGGYFNKVLQNLRVVFEIAQERGQLRGENPARRISKAEVQPERYHLPTAAQFAAILAELDKAPQKRQRDCRDLIEGLSWTGLRLGEARALSRQHFDLVNREITLPPELCKGRLGRKHGRTLPILPEAQGLFERLYRDATPEGKIFHVSEAPKTLKRACAAVGWTEHFSHHSCRHFFATRCLEATGGDVLTVAGWLGHTDKGKLLLSTYAHLCQTHSRKTAEKIRFNLPENVVELKTA